MEIQTIHNQLSDVLSRLHPINAQIYVFSKQGFSDEAITFVEDEANWIPHWWEGENEEEDAVINLIKIEDKGQFSVVSMPWLNNLREERLVTTNGDYRKTRTVEQDAEHVFPFQ